MKEVSGRHSHFGHPYGARIQFRDSLVCLVTTFPNSIILQHHQEKNGMTIYKSNVLSHNKYPSLHEISLLFKKKKKGLQVSRNPSHVWEVAHKNTPQQDHVQSHESLPSQNTKSPLSLFLCMLLLMSLQLGLLTTCPFYKGPQDWKLDIRK